MNSTFYVPTKCVTLRNPLPSPREIKAVAILDGDWDIKAEPVTDSPIYQSIKKYLDGDTSVAILGYRKRIKSGNIKQNSQSRIRHLRDSILKKGVIPNGNDNIRVAIGRDGQIIAVDGGTHRLMLAHIMGIPRIPVEVMGRHPDWDVLRKEIRALETIPYQQFPHPDLQDFPWYFNDTRADLVLPHLKGNSLIDLGCRYGAECHRMEREGWDCIGIEKDARIVDAANVIRKALHSKFTIWQGNATDIPPMTADVLLAYNVLVYLRKSPDYERMLKNLNVKQVVFSARETDKGANGSLDATQKVAKIMGKSQIKCIGTDKDARHPKRRTSIGSIPRKIYIIE